MGEVEVVVAHHERATHVVRAWWSVRSLLAVRWLVQHGFDPSPEVAVLRARM